MPGNPFWDDDRFWSIGTHRDGNDLHVTAKQFNELQWRMEIEERNRCPNRIGVVRDWLWLMHLEPSDFEDRQTNIVVDWGR